MTSASDRELLARLDGLVTRCWCPWECLTGMPFHDEPQRPRRRRRVYPKARS